jgi:hypothetical protein
LSNLVFDSVSTGAVVSWLADVAVGCASSSASAGEVAGWEDAFETVVAVKEEEVETSLSVPELLMTSLGVFRCLTTAPRVEVEVVTSLLRLMTNGGGGDVVMMNDQGRPKLVVVEVVVVVAAVVVAAHFVGYGDGGVAWDAAVGLSFVWVGAVGKSAEWA